MIKSKIPEYIIHNNVAFYVLPRKKGQLKTDECRFCGIKHTHGKTEGHRVAHCVDIILNGKPKRIVSGFITSDGTQLRPSNGYFIIEYP